MMVVFLQVLHKFVAPLLTGMCMTAASVASGTAAMLALIATAVVLVFFCHRAATRLIAVETGAPA